MLRRQALRILSVTPLLAAASPAHAFFGAVGRSIRDAFNDRRREDGREEPTPSPWNYDEFNRPPYSSRRGHQPMGAQRSERGAVAGGSLQSGNRSGVNGQ